MTLIPIRDGEIAAVVTALEMRARPAARPLPASPLRLERWAAPTLPAYRQLFTRIGARWLWFSRLAMSDEALAKIIHTPETELYVAIDRRGIEVGMLELNFLQPATCEIAYFGLIPELAGRGIGRWLMANAFAIGWRGGIERMWVHTCTLDHPRALGFYRAQGFVPFGRSVETFPDPRTTGHLPIDAAPQVPLLSRR